MADNAAVVRRIQARACDDSAAMNALGQKTGPSATPVVSGDPVHNFQSCCESIVQQLKIANDLSRKQFTPMIGDRPFISMPVGGSLDVLPITSGLGKPVSVADVKIIEGHIGMLDLIGVAVYPPAAMQYVTFQVKLNQDVVPLVSSGAFTQNTLATPIPFPMLIPSGTTLSVTAINNGTSRVKAAAMLVGRMRLL